MPRTDLTVQSIHGAGTHITYRTVDNTADVTNGLEFAGAGGETLRVITAAASGVTLTLLAPACEHGRLGGGTGAAATGVPNGGDLVFVVAASDELEIPVPAGMIQKSGAAAGKVLLNVAGTSGTVKVAVTRK